MLTAGVTANWEGRPLEELNRFIELRARQLNESAHDALFATAQTFIRSIGPQVKVAKTSQARLSYEIEDTGLVMGKHHGHYMPHTPYAGDYRRDVRPICLWGGGFPKHRVHVWRIKPRHGRRMTWRMNKNKGCWYVAAYSISVAHTTAKRLMLTAIKKNRGLARGAINAMRVAIARLENSGEDPLASAIYGAAEGSLLVGRQLERTVQRFGGWDRIGQAQYVLTTVGDSRNYGLLLSNNLDYAVHSFKNGAASISLALMKAANSIAGYLRRRSRGVLNPALATPFPEIARSRRKTK